MAWSDVFGELLKFLNRIILRPSREIKKVVRIYDVMHKVLSETDVQRMLIVKVHNSGGLIRPTTPLYISVLYEDYGAPFETIKDDYQKMQLDEESIRMILSMCQQGSIKVKTKDMKEGMTRDIYLSQGIKYAEYHFLGQDRKALYFAELESAWEDGWENSPTHKVAVKVAVNSLKNHIS